jgi:hypothetical protein
MTIDHPTSDLEPCILSIDKLPERSECIKIWNVDL